MKKNIAGNCEFDNLVPFGVMGGETYAPPPPSLPGSSRASYALKKSVIFRIMNMLIINMFFSNMLIGQGGLQPGDRIGDLIILKAYSYQADTLAEDYHWVFTRYSTMQGYDPTTSKYRNRKTERRDVDVVYRRLPDDQLGNEVWLFNVTNYGALYAYPKTYITVGDYVEHKYWVTENPVVNPKESDVSYVVFIRYRLYDDGQISDAPYWFSILQWPERENCTVLSN